MSAEFLITPPAAAAFAAEGNYDLTDLLTATPTLLTTNATSALPDLEPNSEYTCRIECWVSIWPMADHTQAGSLKSEWNVFIETDATGAVTTLIFETVPTFDASLLAPSLSSTGVSASASAPGFDLLVTPPVGIPCVATANWIIVAFVEILPSPVPPLFGTYFPTGSSATWSAAPINGDTVTPTIYGGWMNLPASPPDGTSFGLSTPYGGGSLIKIQYSAGQARWWFWCDGGSLFAFEGDGGLIWIALVATTNICTLVWRWASMRVLAQATFAWDPKSTTRRAFTITGAEVDLACWFAHEGALTMDQLLAQSRSATPIVAMETAVLWAANDGSDLFGAHPMTLVGTSASATAVPCVPEPLPELDICTLLDRINGFGNCWLAESPFDAAPAAVTVVGWAKWPDLTTDPVNYIVNFDADGSNTCSFAMQYTYGTNALFITGATGFFGAHGYQAYATEVGIVVPADCNGWCRFAVTFEVSGADTIVTLYLGLNEAQLTLAASDTITNYLMASLPRTTFFGKNCVGGHLVEGLRIFDSLLNLVQMNAVLDSTDPAAGAWIDVSFGDTDARDRSANSRNPIVNGSIFAGGPGPTI